MSIDFKFTARVDRPVETVCAAVTDLKSMPDWFSIQAIRNITPGPLAVGTQFQVVTKVMGSDQVLNYRVTEYEPCEKFAYASDGKFPTQVTLSVLPTEEGTALTFELSAKVSRLIAPMVKGPIKEQTRNDFSRLVEAIEAGKYDGVKESRE